MTPYAHLPEKPLCPFLPPINEVLKPSDIKGLKGENDREQYYLATLKCAHSLWLCGLPAQSLLQLNFSLGEDLPEDCAALSSYPLPYPALQWILKNSLTEEFLGNPVRHYQHLASRMSGKNTDLRTLRAWVCFHLASDALSPDAFPKDQDQLVREKLIIPPLQAVLTSLREAGKTREAEQINRLMTQ